MTDTSKSAQQAKDQNASDKTKPSKKRKRTICGVSLGKSADTEAATVEPGRRKKTKHDKIRIHHPDPTTDESLSEQSRRALLYAFERCQKVEHWKFNKARQNWLLRNVWSEQAVPETYFSLVIEYLTGIRGGAREKLIAVCTSKVSTTDDPQPFDDNTEVGSAIKPNVSRASSVLNALRSNSPNHKFD